MTIDGKRGMGILKHRHAQNTLLVLASVTLCMGVIEVWLRLFDPAPFYLWFVRQDVITEHDPILGWKGRPNLIEVFSSPAYKTVIEHNSQGFRDIEHGRHNQEKPAIVFLGDSFTWGFEVHFEDMFVNRLRRRLSKYSVFNLSQSRYGTDQELLTFQNWHTANPLELVVVMFYENDIADNNSDERWGYPKPLFQMRDDELILTNVPVPKSAEDVDSKAQPSLLREIAKAILVSVMKSHAVSDLSWRLERIYKQWTARPPSDDMIKIATDMTITRAILRQLKTETEARGGRLVLVAIPHPNEIYGASGYMRFQEALEAVARTLNIAYLDLAPALLASNKRTYHRRGIHLNAHGHQVVADTLQTYLATTQGIEFHPP